MVPVPAWLLAVPRHLHLWRALLLLQPGNPAGAPGLILPAPRVSQRSAGFRLPAGGNVLCVMSQSPQPSPVGKRGERRRLRRTLGLNAAEFRLHKENA